MAHRTRIAVVNYPYEHDVADADALLERYVTLADWSEAIAAAGVTITVVQRFHRPARFTRNGVEYAFCADGGEGHPHSRRWPRPLHQMVRSVQPDLVHVNGLNVPVQTWLLKRVLPSSTALVVQDHGGGAGPGEGPAAAVSHSAADRFRLAVKRVAMRAADAFLFTAAAQADGWRRAGLITPDQQVHQVLEAS